VWKNLVPEQRIPIGKKRGGGGDCSTYSLQNHSQEKHHELGNRGDIGKKKLEKASGKKENNERRKKLV